MGTDFKDNSKDIAGDKTMPLENGPVSKIEKNQLEKERDKPKQNLEYTPGGSLEQNTHERTSKQRENRINHIEKRLKNAREKKQLKRNFDRES